MKLDPASLLKTKCQGSATVHQVHRIDIIRIKCGYLMKVSIIVLLVGGGDKKTLNVTVYR